MAVLLSLLHVVRVGDKHLPRLAPLRFAHDPVLLQQINEAGGARVADAQPALKE